MSKLLQDIEHLITDWREGRTPAEATERAVSDLLEPDRRNGTGHRRPPEKPLYQKPLG